MVPPTSPAYEVDVGVVFEVTTVTAVVKTHKDSLAFGESVLHSDDIDLAKGPFRGPNRRFRRRPPPWHVLTIWFCSVMGT
jgi:hypothetical protein